MYKRIGTVVAMALLSLPVLAQEAPAPAASAAKNLPAVVVSGELPGPGLWKVSKGDHVLWILGTLSPLPKKMQWQSQQVEAVELGAQALLLPPSIEVGAKGGFFSHLFLLPRLIGIRKNPDDKKLVDVLPPPVYARWQGLKARYIGHDGGVEKFRPIFAAGKLYEAAVKDAGLSDDNVVGQQVRKLAKQHDIAEVSTSFEFTIADPKAAIAEFRHGSMDDTACLVQTMDQVEHDLPHMQAEANAWATGDIDTLASLRRDRHDDACDDAFNGSDLARQQGLQDVRGKVAQSWLKAATDALAKNQRTFALLPMGELLSPKGYLAELKAQGYTVATPNDLDDDPAPASSTAPSPAGNTTGSAAR